MAVSSVDDDGLLLDGIVGDDGARCSGSRGDAGDAALDN